MIEPLVNQADITHDQRLEPPFGMETPERLMARAMGRAHAAQTADQAEKCRRIRGIERTLLRADPEHDLLSALERR